MPRGYALAALYRLMTPACAVACAYMANHEYRTLAGDFPRELLQEALKKGWLAGVVTGRDDPWFPDWQQRIVQKHVGDEQVC